MSDREEWPISLAKQAYVDGRISLDELERALADRLESDRFKGDVRIDGMLPGRPKGYADD